MVLGVGGFITAPSSRSSSFFAPLNFRSENLPIWKFTNFCHETGQSPISSPMIPGFLNRPQAGGHEVDGVHMALVPASPPPN